VPNPYPLFSWFPAMVSPSPFSQGNFMYAVAHQDFFTPTSRRYAR
jgi:hypothetical protein